MAKRRGYMGSTEPQARKVEQQALAGRRKKPTKKVVQMDPTKPTATTPKGVQKTKAQGEQEREKLRKKQRERIRGAKRHNSKSKY